jgi:hypothetical protein
MTLNDLPLEWRQLPMRGGGAVVLMKLKIAPGPQHSTAKNEDPNVGRKYHLFKNWRNGVRSA